MRALVNKWSMLLAGLLFFSGLAASSIACFKLHVQRAEIERSRQLIARVSDLESQLDSISQAKKQLASLQSTAPQDLDAILRDSGLAASVTDSRSGVESLDDGWSVLTREIAFGDLILADLDTFLVSCHQSRPPWVLSEVSLKSSPFESGRARASVTMQALRRKSK